MKKFAIIPGTQEDYKDKFFYRLDSNTEFRSEASLEKYIGFTAHGDVIHTIDMYDDISEPDYYLFLWPDWYWVNKLKEIGTLQRAIYCNAEPPTVIGLNCESGYRILRKIFPAILTYNRDWVDNKQIFKRNNPYFFKTYLDNIPWKEKKLITGISADKKSRYKYELYSERERAYRFFETKCADQFTFYGTRWNKKAYPCYGGIVEDKADTFHHFKFALCLENTSQVKDYVTEKMLDCLCAGIVPIYGGAPNICDYIPQECFIDYFSFSSLDSLADYLINMNENVYREYIFAAKRWLLSDAVLLFSYKEYVDSIYFAIDHESTFELQFSGIFWIKLFSFGTKIKQTFEKVKAKIKHIILRAL